MGNSIFDSDVIFKFFLDLGLTNFFRRTVLRHIMSILIAVFMSGYKGKVSQMSEVSPRHRTTIAHFLNHGDWEEEILAQKLKENVIRLIFKMAILTGKPIICIVDDTISSKTKPSSRALHPIEDAYYHQSHLKKRQDYGHQAVAVLLSCNGVTLPYDIVMYDKTKSKIQIVCEIANELPVAPVLSYFECDCWYTCVKVMDVFLVKGFYCIGAIKTNRVIYPKGIKQSVAQFAQLIRKTDSNVSLVTVGKRIYYVYRYEGNLNDLEDAVVLISYPKDAFGKPGALRAFLCTNASLSTQEILDLYLNRWEIEVFFRQSKQKLAFDKYQIRLTRGIRRFWILMSLAYYLCCTGTGEPCCFHEGFALLRKAIAQERVTYIYNCGVSHVPLSEVLACAA